MVTVWVDSGEALTVYVPVQATAGPPSSEQVVVVAVASLTVHVIVAGPMRAPGGGWLVIVMTGAVVSTVQVALSEPVLPCASVAVTVTVWVPSVRLL
jgi:hypothetical protein